MICAPFLIWARAISAAASQSPAATSRLNLRLPSTFVRSPTRTGRLSTSASMSSIPENRVFEWIAGRRGFLPSAAAAMARMWAGVVPQQPPTMLTQPSCMKWPSSREIDSGVSEYWPSTSGSPAFG